MIDHNIQFAITCYRYAHRACHPRNRMLSSGMNQHCTTDLAWWTTIWHSRQPCWLSDCPHIPLLTAVQQQQATRDRLRLGFRRVVDKTAATAARALAMPGWMVPALSPFHTAYIAVHLRRPTATLSLSTLIYMAAFSHTASLYIDGHNILLKSSMRHVALRWHELTTTVSSI